MHGILKLRSMIQHDPSMGWRERYGAVGTEELLPGAPEEAPTAVNVLRHGDTGGAAPAIAIPDA
jgi:NADH-quinone oxidoreductase subunit B